MYRALNGIEEPELNPIFRLREGPVEAWEKSRECARLRCAEGAGSRSAPPISALGGPHGAGWS